MRRVICIMFLALSGAVLTAQDVEVKTWFDSSRVYIGDQVYYNIQVDQPANLSLLLNRKQDTLVSLINILDAKGPDTTRLDNNRISILSRYLITSFDSGSYDIPPFYAELDSSGKIYRYYSDYAHLDVIRTDIVPSDTTDVIFDIVAPMRERITAGEILPWILLVIIVSAIVLFVIRKIKAKRLSAQKTGQERIPGEPIHIMILRELDKLERQHLWQKGEVKEFYSKLTEILRYFIELKYQISSLEMTTSETLDALVEKGIAVDHNWERLKDILVTADLSKFAKYAPSENVNEGMIDLARLYVRTASSSSEQDTVIEEVNSYEGKEADHA